MGGSPLLFATILTAAFLVGVMPALVEGFKTTLGQRHGLGEKTARRLDRWFTAAYIVGLLASGMVIDQLGVKGVFFGGALVAALGLASIALSFNYRGTVLALLATGAAHACLTTSCIYLMPHPWQERDAIVQRMNLGFIAVGLGNLLAPLGVLFLSNPVRFRPRLLMLSLFFLVPATLMSILPIESLPELSAQWNPADFLFDPRLAMAGLIAFLYCPLEGSLSTWARSYLAELGFSNRRVAFLMLGYWTLFLASRYAAGLFLGPGREMWLLFALTLIAAMIFGNLRGAFSPTSGAFAFILVGAVTGPFFPTVLGVGSTLTLSEPATALSGLFALGSIGNVLFHPPLRAFASSHSVRITLRIPMLHALILAIPTLILMLIRYN